MGRDHSNSDNSHDSGPIVSGSAVLSAGIASAAAATLTSRFGVAGTLLGAALTTMIITGGAAILKAYLEAATGKVRRAPGWFRARRDRRKARRYAEPTTVPDRPDLRNNFVGRMRAALGWFSRLPVSGRRSILIKGLIAAAVAFVIGLAVIYGAERLIGNNFSCGFWGKCPPGATPGIHPLGYGEPGAGTSINPGRSDAGAVSQDGTRVAPFGNPSGQQRDSFFGGGQQDQTPSSAPSSAQPEEEPSSAPSSAQPEEEPSSASSSAQPEDEPSSAPSSAPAQSRGGPSSAPSSAPPE
ncbi:MAG: hypothetical protein ACR2JR_09610 [Rubrobacteraceae bacterium]